MIDSTGPIHTRAILETGAAVRKTGGAGVCVIKVNTFKIKTTSKMAVS